METALGQKEEGLTHVMSEKEISPEEREQRFLAHLVAEYLKYGSVDEVYKNHKYDIPISYPGFQRVLDKWGIVKAAGPNSKLSEALSFFVHLAKEQIPLETLYKKMPSSFQTSMGTLHRILSYIKEGVTRRVGTALVITPYGKADYILVGNDVSTPRVELGKPFGSVSLPMGFSKKRDTKDKAILRVLQQEVFAKLAITQEMPMDIFKDVVDPFMYLDIADVRVSIYHLILPKELSSSKSFSSFKLENHRFLSIGKIIKSDPAHLRIGMVEAVMGYQRSREMLDKNVITNPIFEVSSLNHELAALAYEY